jgi:type IV pilus assembly protein PilZ
MSKIPGAPAGGATTPTRSVLSLTIADKKILQTAYMSQLKNGGIFIPTDRSLQLGDEVYLLLALMEDQTKYPLVCKVAWINFRGSADRQPGVGVHFPADEAGRAARKRIEEILGPASKSIGHSNTF